jgi:hypothetical protein
MVVDICYANTIGFRPEYRLPPAGTRRSRGAFADVAGGGAGDGLDKQSCLTCTLKCGDEWIELKGAANVYAMTNGLCDFRCEAGR